MARRRTSHPTPPTPPPPPPQPARPAVTPERFTRLYRLLSLLGEAPRTREQITHELGLDVRGFYRDLELLRAVGIEVQMREGQYTLDESAEAAIARLPFPDPHLTLGEARQLARGRTKLHQALQQRIAKMCEE
jgi:predicted DNA-binding transcriptional regulator YafY